MFKVYLSLSYLIKARHASGRLVKNNILFMYNGYMRDAFL